MKIHTKLVVALAGTLAALTLTGEASAQKADKGAGTKGQPFEIGAIIITARPTRPSAVVELGKILPEIEIAKIRQPFLNKIEEALSGEPF